MSPQTPPGPKVLSALLAAQSMKQEELLQTLRGLQAEIRLQPGCLECVLGPEEGGEARVLFFTVWSDKAHLEAHMASEAFGVLLGATQVLCLPDSVRFLTAEAVITPPSRPIRPRSLPA